MADSLGSEHGFAHLPRLVSLCFHFTDMPWLIVIWMTVAPVPVIVLILMFLMLVGKISLVALVLVSPVCALLALVPVVIVVVPRVVDTDLDMVIVWRCRGDDAAACRKGCRYQKRCYV